MRRFTLAVLSLTLSVLQSPDLHARNASDTGVKEWTFLVYLNGNNNLDSWGHKNMNQMEAVGSTDQVNIVVQWASLMNGNTQRVFITKDNDPDRVTSPIVGDMGNVDMGDWKSLVEFVRWGVANYPAKHYFIDVWDHGSGWHLKNSLTNSMMPRTFFNPMDISFDDRTGHAISTRQLGQAMEESAQIIGHKVDLYASDACLMAMAEIGGELADSVHVFAGSEEVEPAAGWPYDDVLAQWTAQPQMSAVELGKLLTQEYVKSYSGGQNGNSEVTFSAFDLTHSEVLNNAISKLGGKLKQLDPVGKKKVLTAAAQTQNFTYRDYADLGDFLNNVAAAQIDLDKVPMEEVRSALNQYVVMNKTTPRFARASGVAIWLPTDARSYSNYAERYKALKFHSQTQWGDALESLF